MVTYVRSTTGVKILSLNVIALPVGLLPQQQIDTNIDSLLFAPIKLFGVGTGLLSRVDHIGFSSPLKYKFCKCL